MKMAQSLNQAARWIVVVAATIALVVAFSLPSAGFFSASSSESVVAFGRHRCGGARRVHRHRGYRSCGSTGCSTSYSPCSTGGCNVGGGCTVGGGCN
ncbi:hypothetical protein M4951_15390 [Blastopirellula sp. J2-11]|uniref:hypothetical protein n=1 Tax=Blastopirellula sp. J2-11 TaxID=2943192 RepID=UPI0021C7788C|nr:hypothetical protein [Blastopirellula sp. J2-11]UUO04770.1 hypothetical protein M4951_15390 [Blastopirellula sp. J2-11]